MPPRLFLGLVLFGFGSALTASWFQGPTPFTMTRQIGVPIWLGSADMNRDGIADLIAVHSGTPLRVRGSTSIGIAVVPADGPLIVSETPFSGDIVDAALGDFNRDSVPDVLVIDRGAFGGDRLCVASGTGQGTIGAIFCTNLTEYSDRVAAGDFNGDGLIDAAITHSLTGQLSLWFGRGDGTFSAGPVAAVPNPGVLAAADLNADGIADVAIHSRAGRLILLTSAQGKPLQTTQTLPASATFSDLALADLNRDGKLDVIGCDTLAGLFAVAFAPFAQPIVTTLTESVPSSLQLADFNGDSVPELLAATTAGMLFAQVATDGRVLLPSAPGFSLRSSIRPAVLDLNRDSRPDLVTYTGALGQSLSLLTAQPSPTTASLEASSLSAAYGQPVTFTARAIASASPPPAVPAGAGTFTLLRAGQAVQQVAAVPAPGAASRDVASARFAANLPVGAHVLTATFSGAPGYNNATSQPITITVQPASVTLRLAAPSNEISRESGLLITATAANSAGPAIDGLVKLFINGSMVAQAPVANGTAQLLVPPGLPLGNARLRLTFESGGYLPATTEESPFVVRGALTAGNAASYRGPLSPDSLVVAAVPGLTAGNTTAELRRPGSPPVPVAVLYAGPDQANLYLPANLPTGPVALHLLREGVSIASGEVTLVRSAPGIFQVAPDGVPAALAALHSPAGSRSLPVFTCDSGPCVLAPLDLGAAGESLVITLFGTGWRNAESVTVRIGDTLLPLLYAGPQPEVPGFDQANVVIPEAIVGAGEVTLLLSAGGAAANPVKLLLRQAD